MVAADALNAVYLEIQRPATVHDHVVLMALRGDGQTVGAACHQVHHRRAVQQEIARIQHGFQGRNCGLQQHHDFKLLTSDLAQRGLKAVDGQKAKPLGKREVLVQQAVAFKGAGILRQHGLVGIKALTAQGLGRQGQNRAARCVAALHQQAQALGVQQFLQARNLFVGADQVQRQAVKRQRRYRQLPRGLHRQPQRAAHRRCKALAGGRQVGRRSGQPRLIDAQRPQPQVLGGAEFAGGLLLRRQPGT